MLLLLSVLSTLKSTETLLSFYESLSKKTDVEISSLTRSYEEKSDQDAVEEKKETNALAKIRAEEASIEAKEQLAVKKYDDIMATLKDLAQDPDHKSVLVIASLITERDAALAKIDSLMEHYWQYADGSCAISMAVRGAEWKLTHVGLWSKEMSVEFKVEGAFGMQEVGHATFVYEDSLGRIWVYSNGGSYLMPKGTPKDPMVIAKLLWPTTTSSVFIDDE